MSQSLDLLGVIEKKGVPVVGSRKIAEVFDKEHKDVLEGIRGAIQTLNESDDLTAEFSAVNFLETTYITRGRKFPEFLLTRDGFTLITMGYGGAKAMRFKVAYIQKFNEMEQIIAAVSAARLEYPEFTAAILDAHEEAKPYHFMNENNMINRIVLGMDAKKFREIHGITGNESIRPHLTLEQITAIEKLQKYDTALLLVEPEFQKRKEALTTYHQRITTLRLVKGDSNVQTPA